MGRACRDSDADGTDVEFANPMDRRQARHRPSLSRLGHDVGNLVFDDFAVGLVLEVGHTGDSRRMVAHGAEEEDNGTAGWIRDMVQHNRRVDLIAAHRDEIDTLLVS